MPAAAVTDSSAADDDWQLLDAATAERVRDLELFARDRL